MSHCSRSFLTTRIIWHSVIVLNAALLTFTPCSADDAKPRYLSGDGSDSSDCQNVFRPCATLAYALQQAGKGDPILAGEGSYQVTDADQLFNLLSRVSHITGGLTKSSHFTQQQANSVISSLAGVPPDYRETFQAAGFKVIADSKGLVTQPKVAGMLKQMKATQLNHGPSECNNGAAAGYPCENLDLLSHLSISALYPGATGASDIWGFRDLNTDREYVIIGLNLGAALVDVSNPNTPWVVATHTGLPSNWRDVKVFQQWSATTERWHAYAYISTEANMGLAIMDLSDLPNSAQELSYVSDFATAHNVLLNNVDYSFGAALNQSPPLLTVAGANLRSGRYRLYGLDKPEAPELLSTSDSGYMHDAAAIHITDSRKDSQCINASNKPFCQLLADFNETTLDIWDTSDNTKPALLSKTRYPSAAYVHSGWWSEDGRYLFVHDELDEVEGGNTLVRVFDMTDLTAPQLSGQWQGPTRAIDHNGFARGNRYYLSNYLQGLTVLDISEPTRPKRVAGFDTLPASNMAAFDGAWGVYPFLPSGTLAVSDISSGLYLLKDNSLLTPHGSLSFSEAFESGVEGENVSLSIHRNNGSNGAISVMLELQHLSTSPEDLSWSPTELHWADGDSSSQTVNFTINDDANIEGLEQLALRLYAPNGGATLENPHTVQLSISDSLNNNRVKALHNKIVLESSQQALWLSFQRLDSSEGDISVDWHIGENTSATLIPSSGTLLWNDGDTRPINLQLTRQDNLDGNDSKFSANLALHLSNPTNTTLSTETVNITWQAQNPKPGSPAGSPAGNGGGALGLWLLMLILLPAMRFKSPL